MQTSVKKRSTGTEETSVAPFPLGVVRIGIGVLILLRTTPILAPLDVLFLRDANPLLGWPEAGFSFEWLSPDIVRSLCVLRTLGAAALTLGLWTAPAGLLVASAGFLVASQSPFGAPATLQLLYQAAALLGLSDASAVIAIRPTPARSPRSSTWLLRVFVASIYGWAGLFKLRPDWLDGRTLAALHDSGAIHGAISDWVLGTPSSRQFVAWGVALFELAAGPLLLWPRTRRPAMAAAYAFHLTLEVTAHPDFLGWGLMALLLVFFT
jgi:uncharacterized membrane protein YphA (DoxX/SURF4 family)